MCVCVCQILCAHCLQGRALRKGDLVPLPLKIPTGIVEGVTVPPEWMPTYSGESYLHFTGSSFVASMCIAGCIGYRAYLVDLHADPVTTAVFAVHLCMASVN